MLTEKQIRRAPKKDYMNEAQLEFFKNHLLELKRETISHIDEARQRLADANRETDELDRALTEEENRLRLRIADRESKLLPKIDEALKRIEEGEYGWCEETGEPIGIERLLLRPTATLCAEAKARQERLERNYRDS
ncbi:MAG: RNA polymerase-binding protein DksA [Gammaproteobacteria bacterium]|jgi:DnaK suppressor protein|nr:RNA polymerase-binding protein DksA [Gammaproteobacteria bacterium]